MSDPVEKPVGRTVRDGLKGGSEPATENALRNEFLMGQSMQVSDPVEKPAGRTVRDGLKGGIDPATMNALRTEFLMGQSRRAYERSNPNIIDLGIEAGHSALYSGIQSPIIGLAQLGDRALAKADIDAKLAERLDYLPAPEHEEFGTKRWHAQVIGGGAGMTVPFMLTRGGLKATGLTLAGRTESAMLTSGKLVSLRNGAVVADGAIAGFAYDFLLTPVSKDEPDFWTARRNHGLTGAATFGTLTAGSVALRAVARPLTGELKGVARLASDVTGGVATGAPAGIVNADVSARLTKGRWATGEERVQGAYTMAMAGGVLSAFHKIPGQDLSPGEKALKSSAQKSGVANLEAMLVERAKQAKTAVVADTTAPAVATPEASRLGGSKKVEGSEASRMTAKRAKEGRELASSDVETKGQQEVKANISPEQRQLLQKGADLAAKAMDPAAPATDMVAFIEYARGEGAPMMPELLRVAEKSNNPEFLGTVREAALPVEGIEHRVIEGEIKISEKPDGKTVTAEMKTNWQQFVDMMNADPPTTPEGYAKARTELFQWLDKNPDLHDWVKQVSKQNSWSNLAGPLDTYFGTNEMARFMEAAKPAAPPREVKPTTMADIHTMQTLAEQFAETALTNPYEANMVENFRALSEKAVGLNVSQLAWHVNEALAKKGLGTLCRVGIDNSWQMTLYTPKSTSTTANVAKVDYSSVPAPEKVSTQGAEDGLAASKAGLVASEGLGIQPDLRHRLEHNITSGATNDISNVETIKINREIQNGILHKQPMRDAFVEAFKAYNKSRTPETKQNLLNELEAGIYKPEVLRQATISKIANEFGRNLSVVKEKGQAEYLFAETALLLKNQGVEAADVPRELNHVIKHNKMPYEVSLNAEGQLELNHVVKVESNVPIISVFYDVDGKLDVRTKFEDPAPEQKQPRKTEAQDQMSMGRFDYGKPAASQGTALEVARESREIAAEFVEDLGGATKVHEATKICQEALLKLNTIGVPASEVPGILNRVLKRNNMKYEVVTNEDGTLELIFHNRK